jgi:DinB superfamily
MAQADARAEGAGLKLDSIADELNRVVDHAAPELRAIDEARAGSKPTADVWSVKEILGHLIDSASNNHQRFVRAQLAGELTFPDYQQNGWVASQDYQSRPWRELLDLWVAYNHHLAHVVQRMPDAAGSVPCRLGTNEPITLTALAQHYLDHVRHHLEQIQQRRNA